MPVPVRPTEVSIIARRYLFWFALTWLLCAGASAGDPATAHNGVDRVHSNGKTALMAAAKAGDSERMRALLEQGVDVNQPNKNGGTAIMYAVLSGKSEPVSLLLEHHAHVDAVAKNGWTPLMIAAVKGYVEVARLLLKHGAEPNRGDVYSWTPLMRAVYEQRPRMVRLLVENDPTDVNRAGENGVTALHLAVAREDADTVRLLLSRDADPTIMDNSGRTALDFARQNGDMGLLRLMDVGHRDRH
ncbi:MAG: ankyrin repeat domain-containing protein [Gammaproteobacteria bacterium]|nr:ankyrin repeat domain-containing protein [Gammaproteobacteria bacterium]